MKSPLVLDLISAHLSGDEASFSQAVERLASDEDAKGNCALALEIREAYRGARRAPRQATPEGEVFAVQGLSDRDTGLGLMDVRTPSAGFGDMVLPADTLERLAGVAAERGVPSPLPPGIRPTRSLLLTGPPGCGKTMAAEAVAQAMGVPLAVVRPDGVVSPYLGQTGANIRRVFEAVRGRRCVLFLDEFESLGKTRADDRDVGEARRMMTALLQNLDSLDEDVLLIAATNLPELLDPAAVRRFDRTVAIGLPDAEARGRLVVSFAGSRGMPGMESLKEPIVAVTEGMSCADVVSVMENAARDAAIRGKEVTAEDLFEAVGGKEAVAERMHAAGATLRDIEDATGIPRSTLSYRFRKVRE